MPVNPQPIDLNTLNYRAVAFIPQEGFAPDRHIREVFRLFERVEPGGALLGPLAATDDDLFRLRRYYRMYGIGVTSRLAPGRKLQLYLTRRGKLFEQVRELLNEKPEVAAPRTPKPRKPARPAFRIPEIDKNYDAQTWVGPRPVVLQAARIHHGLSARQLAKRLGCHAKQVQRWESGHTPVPRKIRSAVELLIHEALIAQ